MDTAEELGRAIKDHKAGDVARMLDADPALATAQWRKRTMLMHAVEAARPETMSGNKMFSEKQGMAGEIIRHLLERGADPNERTPGPNGESLLHLAARTAAFPAVKQLLAHPQIDREARGGERNDTPLLTAVHALLWMPAIIHQSLKRPNAQAERQAAYNAQAKDRHHVRAQLSCAEMLMEHCDLNAAVTLGFDYTALRHLGSMSGPRFAWLNGKTDAEDVILRLCRKLLGQGVDPDQPILVGPQSEPSRSTLLQGLLMERVPYVKLMRELLMHGARQDVPFPSQPYTIREYFTEHAPPDSMHRDLYKEALNNVLNNVRATRGPKFQPGQRPPLAPMLLQEKNGDPALTTLARALIQFEKLPELFDDNFTDQFRGEQERLETAMRIETLSPGATGIYFRRNAPLARPDTCVTAEYLRGNVPELKL